MGRKKKNPDPYEAINKKLDLLVAVILAQLGLQKSTIAKILDVSEKTIQRMFSGQWSKIQRDKNTK